MFPISFLNHLNMFNNASSSGSDFLSLETSLRYSLNETELPVMSADTVLAASDACSLSKIKNITVLENG